MPHPGPTPDWAQIPSRLRILLDTGLLDTDTPLSYVVTGSRFKVLHTSQSCPALASLKAGRLPGKAGGWRTRTAGDLAAHVTDDDTRVPADAWRNRDERTGCCACVTRPDAGTGTVLPERVLAVLTWICGTYTFFRPSGLYGRSIVRCELLTRPPATGHPGVDAYADAWAAWLEQREDRIIATPDYQDDLDELLLDGWTGWYRGAVGIARSKPRPGLGQPPEPGEDLPTRLRSRQVWVRLAGTDWPTGRTQHLASATFIDAESRLVRLPAAAAATHPTELSAEIITLDDGYDHADVLAAAAIAPPGADYAPLIAALRASRS